MLKDTIMLVPFFVSKQILGCFVFLIFKASDSVCYGISFQKMSFDKSPNLYDLSVVQYYLYSICFSCYFKLGLARKVQLVKLNTHSKVSPKEQHLMEANEFPYDELMFYELPGTVELSENFKKYVEI